MFEVNTKTDILFLQRQICYASSRAHRIYQNAVKMVASNRLATRTREIDDGTYYTLVWDLDRDMIDRVLKEVDDNVDGEVRFIWKFEDGTV